MSLASVCVSIVAFNSAGYIARCLQAVLAQRGVKLDVVVIDNASTDGTWKILESFGSRISKFRIETNIGFAAGQNKAISLSKAPWILALNPDVLLEPDFVARLVEAGSSSPRIGAVCGKLLAIGRNFEPLPERLFDSTGIVLTPALRHLDRGWHEPDRGQYDQREYVFGATGAAALYRRAMIEDVSGSDGFFDPDFFCYREDADVAWRAQLLGWRCLYVPEAEAHHVRRVTPEVRKHLPAAINMHSVKNRFLMRIKNMTPDLYRRFWLSITARDLVVVGCCLLREHRSLPAFVEIAKHWKSVWAKRQSIMRKRRVTDDYMAQWFVTGEASAPAPVEAPVALRRIS